MIWCSKCFIAMNGIKSRIARDICEPCGGEALGDKRWHPQKEAALNRLKSQGELSQEYHFRDAS